MERAPDPISIGVAALLAALESALPELPLALVNGEGRWVIGTGEGRRQADLGRPCRQVPVGPFLLRIFESDGDTEAPVDPQLLRFAADIAQSRAAERESNRTLRETVQRLEHALSELAAAHADLARQRDEMHDRAPQSGGARRPAGPRSEERLHEMVSADPAMLRIFDTIRLVASSGATVLVQGESGTGKELVARALHHESERVEGPFVAVNCAAIAASLAESELFGHRRGAFTGAVADAPGVFTRAHGGTLFLDEVAELPLELQSKLLRAVQERVIQPVGAREPVAVDVRLVAATHKSLPEEVAAGRFREDLMYRLRVVPLELPPLRDRPGDIDVLVRVLIQRLNERTGRTVASVAPAAVRALKGHDYPGNVRELHNAVEHAFAVSRGDRIELEHLPRDLLTGGAASLVEPPRTLDDHAGRGEAAAIRDALAQSNGRISEAADLLGVSRATFHRKRRKHGIE